MQKDSAHLWEGEYSCAIVSKVGLVEEGSNAHLSGSAEGEDSDHEDEEGDDDGEGENEDEEDEDDFY